MKKKNSVMFQRVNCTALQCNVILSAFMEMYSRVHGVQCNVEEIAMPFNVVKSACIAMYCCGECSAVQCSRDCINCSAMLWRVELQYRQLVSV